MTLQTRRLVRRTAAVLAALLISAAAVWAGYQLVLGTRQASTGAARTGEQAAQSADPRVEEILRNLSEEAAVLFGAAAVALTLATFLVTLLAFIGWVEIKSSIEDQVEASMGKYHRIERGRILGHIGLTYGNLSRGFTKQQYLSAALIYLRKSNDAKSANEKITLLEKALSEAEQQS